MIISNLISIILWALHVSTVVGDGIPKDPRRNPRREPLPLCKTCIPWEQITAPGVGIHLSIGYGLAAVKLDDGSFIDVAKVDANPEYLSFMRQKAKEVPEDPGRDYTWREILQIRLQAIKRRYRKLMGQPGTPEAGSIADLIKSLLVETELELGLNNPLTGVALSVPFLPDRVPIVEYLEDAAEYLGIKILRSANLFAPLREFGSAYAAMGFGLCEHYRDYEECEFEDTNLTHKDVLGVSFNDASVSVYCGRNRNARYSIAYEGVQEPSLGHNSLQAGNSKAYWKEIKDLIVSVGKVQLLECRWRPEVMLIMGDAVDAVTEDLTRTVREALQELFPGDTHLPLGDVQVAFPEKDKNHYLYLPARGTAEFARRFQGQPFGCVESLECRANRPGANKTDANIKGQILVQGGH
ncbi:hypothetical protein TWF730_010218 [Orbilia blumenaviensis]|uniref:Uncharacterized protein n=1 Tax=Orbilia blumenaviensis TaxID=1796055 RepID=A0AAV9UNL5_9PEZI